MSWKTALPLLFIAAVIFFEEHVSMPSCVVVKHGGSGNDLEEFEENSEDLKVMMVANLLLLGSEAGYINIYFRDSYTTKFFRKSFERLKPDMLVVLGDISAKGSELTNIKWLSVLQQFQRMVGPFLELPLHIVLGDRDIGECSKINAQSVDRRTRSLPGLDSAGCGAFEISNISFVSLNAVALLCDNNDLRFSLEKVLERESVDLQTHTMDKTGLNEHNENKENFGNFQWRENAVLSGSGPVLLLHFPLHKTSGNCEGINTLKENFRHNPHLSSKKIKNRRFDGVEPYDLLHAVPPNATEYIFQALRPRIVFSAHTHQFCDHTHRDGTREVSVPAMSWDARDDPGFVIVTFRQNKAVTVSQCSLARESHVVMAYVSAVVILISTLLIAKKSRP